MEEAQRANDRIDISTDATRYKEAVNSLTAAISDFVGAGLLPETTDIALAACELEQRMQAKVTATSANISPAMPCKRRKPDFPVENLDKRMKMRYQKSCYLNSQTSWHTNHLDDVKCSDPGDTRADEDLSSIRSRGVRRRSQRDRERDSGSIEVVASGRSSSYCAHRQRDRERDRGRSRRHDR